VRLAHVLWNGSLGGAETFSAMLARQLRADGVIAGVVFVGDPQPLATNLDRDEVPYTALGLQRGRRVLRHPRALARAVRELGADGALLVSPGFLAAALRFGGYKAPVVVVNHGAFMHDAAAPAPKRLKQRADATSGAWAAEIEVAVSDLVLQSLRRRPHARRLVRIYNGIDLELFRPSSNGGGRVPTIGWAGRLVPGKGVDDLIRAFAQLEGARVLRIAGDGPLRGELEGLAASLGLADSVRFEGSVAAMPSFWNDCDVAAMPSNTWIESFGMAAAEAMACGLPVVATRSGALSEVVEDARTGVLCDPGDVTGIAAALRRYASDPALRQQHGAAARRSCEARFDLRRCAVEYRALFDGAGG
jgi:glycosyltransferase involved in cell wall biosynthesis